jgi:hypothetical protein
VAWGPEARDAHIGTDGDDRRIDHIAATLMADDLASVRALYDGDDELRVPLDQPLVDLRTGLSSPT